MVLRFAFKTLMLTMLVMAGQVLIFGPMQQSEPVKKFENCLKQQPDVIYFCDSCNAWVDAKDVDRRWISQLLHDRLPNKRVVSLDGGAFHLELYSAFVDALIKREQKPDLLVIPINLRSFSPEWDARPSYAFSDTIRQLQELDQPFVSAFAPLLKTLQWKRDTTLSLSEYRRTIVRDGEKVVGTVADFEGEKYSDPTPEKLRNKFIFHYMYSLSADHRKLVALRQIAERTAKAGIPVVFYVTPVDFETGLASVGPRFAEQVTINISRIRQQIAEYPVSFIDLSDGLSSSAFSWLDYPNEHLNQVGRDYVATQLAQHLADEYAFHVRTDLRMASDPQSDEITR